MIKTTGKRALISLVISIAIAVPNLSIPASAVTFGSLVPDPAIDAPYVVSIWTSENNDSRNAEFICTGTLIAPQIVLTAAHCTTDVGSYFVKVKSQALNDRTTFTSVSGVWTSPRYDARNFTNDVGLLKLDETFTDIEFPSLANALAEKSINKFSKLRIYGWGRDQDKKLADLLRTSDLLLQDSIAAKTFGKSFNKKTMISAGKKIAAEKVWSGACNGDSGGPLIAKINDIKVIVGVTSWGAANCVAGKPSIFARVSYYLNDIKSGIKAVQTQSEVVNRTAPIAIVDPSIQGEAVPGKNLTCFKGEWKNAVSVQLTWLSPARLLGSTKPEISVLASDGGSEFRCSIDVFSKNASVKRNLTKTIIGKAALVSKPSISGLQSGAIVKPGMIARCEGWNWQTPVDSERIEWFTTSSSAPSTPVNGRSLGQGASLSLSADNIRGEKGRYLVCQVTGIKDGFESHFATTFLLNTAVAPTLTYASISGYSLNEGSSLTCQFSSSGDIDETRIEWGTPAGSNSINPFPGIQGANISINRSIIQQGAGRNLACRVSVSNSGGESVRVATSSNIFESAPNTPSVSANLYGTPAVGSTATCSASSSSYGATISYQWGQTRTSGARSFEGAILGSSSSYTISSASLEQLAGSFLTCVATATNSAGTSQSASSIAIPATQITLPVPGAPVISAQTSSDTSTLAKIRIPTISNFNSNTMQLRLNVVNSPNCQNKDVEQGVTYDCTGLSANTSYTASITVSALNNSVTATRSANAVFTTPALSPAVLANSALTADEATVGVIAYLNDVSCPISNPVKAAEVNATTGIRYTKCWPQAAFDAWRTGGTTWTTYLNNAKGKVAMPTLTAPTITPLSNSTIRVTNAPITGYDATTMNTPQLRIGSGTTRGLYASGETWTQDIGASDGLTISAYIYMTRKSDGYEVRSNTVTFTMPRATDTTSPSITSGNFAPTSISVGQTVTASFILQDTTAVAGCSATVYNSNNIDVMTSTACTRASGTAQNGAWQIFLTMNNSNGPGSYTVKVSASDTNGNVTPLTSIGGFSIVGPSVANLGTLPTPATIGINYVDQIVLNGFNLGSISGFSSGYNWTVKVTNSSGITVATLPVGSNQTYITGLSGSTTYRVSLVATDSAGGTKSSAVLTITTLIPADTQAPVINSNSVTVTPSSLYENGNISLVVPASDNLGISLISARIRINGQTVSSGGNGLTTGVFNLSRTSGTSSLGTWSGTTGMNFKYGQSDGYLLPGIYDLDISATDAAGNSSSITKEAAFILGAQAGGAIIASANIESVSGSFLPGSTVRLNANVIAYNQTISAVRFTSDGYNLNKNGVLAEVSGNSYSKYYSTTFVIAANQAPGNFTINLIAETANGRSSGSNSVSITVVPATVLDTQAPSALARSASLSSPSITGQTVSVPNIGNISDGMSTNSDFTVSMEVSDNVGVASVTFYVDTSGDPSRMGTQIPSTIGYANLISGNSKTGVWSASSRFPSISDLSRVFSTACGRYTVRVIAYDAAGNTMGPLAARVIDIVSCSQ